MPFLLAAAAGLTLGTKLLIGFGAGGTTLGIGAGVYAYFWGAQDGEDKDEKEKIAK